MFTAFRSRLFVSIASFALLGCDRDESGDGDETTDTHGEATDTEAGDCAAETRDDDFAIGLSKSDGLVEATFVSATPAPPIKGDNTWIIDFSDSEGQPLADLEIVVNLLMPDHGHGTPVPAYANPTEVVGRYEITPVNLFMTGYWEITFDIASGSEQSAVTFGFCVE